MGPDGSRGSSTTSLVASHFSRGQQFGSCCQSKKVKGIVNESQSGPGGDSATPPVALLILLDLPGKQTQGSVSSQFRFFKGEGRGPAGRKMGGGKWTGASDRWTDRGGM